MANLEIGIEFWPWNNCRELLSYGVREAPKKKKITFDPSYGSINSPS